MNGTVKINYIYLLQEREFIKTNENIYKIGRTEQENYQRFNQYPKGTILLFQMMCSDCKNTETNIIKEFKNVFKQRIDIGNEYFEGDYNIMIDIIYANIKNEKQNNCAANYVDTMAIKKYKQKVQCEFCKKELSLSKHLKRHYKIKTS
jgi:hypothetical protein